MAFFIRFTPDISTDDVTPVNEAVNHGELVSAEARGSGHTMMKPPYGRLSVGVKFALHQPGNVIQIHQADASWLHCPEDT